MPNSVYAEFHHTMRAAQELHGQGKFADAQRSWQHAADILPEPDIRERARAIRGDAASAAKLKDYGYAERRARAAYAMHRTVLEAATGDDRLPALREFVASGGLLGRLVIGGLIRQERHEHLPPKNARSQAVGPLLLLEGAWDGIIEAEALTQAADQHKINLVSGLTIAHGLYGDRLRAEALLKEAHQLARQSEADGLATAANISADYRRRAQQRALVRARAAGLAVRLATPGQSLRRRAALRVAGNPYLGL
jgi:hypothetical protein